MEMRLYIQSSEGGDDAVEAFQKQVMPKASVISATGDAIAIFREVQCLTPRYGAQFYLVNHYQFKMTFFFLETEVVMTSKFSSLSFNCTARRLTTKFRHQQFCDFSCFPTRMVVKCFLWYVFIQRFSSDCWMLHSLVIQLLPLPEF